MRGPDGNRRGFFALANLRSNKPLLLGLSILLQVVIGLFFGHAYDMRIFMATGYLTGTGQDPYAAQNLISVFHDPTFQGITTVGYPPPWALLLGLIYLLTYKVHPNLLLYNLAIKIPIIAANICLAFLVSHVLKRSGVEEKSARRAWAFMLFNPFLLYASSAWGQFDSIVALLALVALWLLSQGKTAGSAILLALAIAFKPTALAIVPAVLIFLLGRPFRQVTWYFSLLIISALLFFVAPFVILGWDPTPILQHWNAHFTVGGGLSFMTFLELMKKTYQLSGLWWLLGLAWVPALAAAAAALKPGGGGFFNLLNKSVILILVFFITRTWVSEPNIILLLPMVLILVSVRKMDPDTLTALWVLPLVFSFFNTSMIQLLFPSLPGLMERLLQGSAVFTTARLVLRILAAAAWLILAGRVVLRGYKADRAAESLPDKKVLLQPWK
jgi:hypothetical protein